MSKLLAITNRGFECRVPFNLGYLICIIKLFRGRIVVRFLPCNVGCKDVCCHYLDFQMPIHGSLHNLAGKMAEGRNLKKLAGVGVSTTDCLSSLIQRRSHGFCADLDRQPHSRPHQPQQHRPVFWDVKSQPSFPCFHDNRAWAGRCADDGAGSGRKLVKRTAGRP